MSGDGYVTEAPGLRTTTVRDIHSVEWLGDMIRIFTVDILKQPGGSHERRINNDILISAEDLNHCIQRIIEETSGPKNHRYREMSLMAGKKGH